MRCLIWSRSINTLKIWIQAVLCSTVGWVFLGEFTTSSIEIFKKCYKKKIQIHRTWFIHLIFTVCCRGEKLIPWMGDPSLKIDKYDGRGYLDNLHIYEPVNTTDRYHTLSVRLSVFVWIVPVFRIREILVLPVCISMTSGGTSTWKFEALYQYGGHCLFA